LIAASGQGRHPGGAFFRRFRGDKVIDHEAGTDATTAWTGRRRFFVETFQRGSLKLIQINSKNGDIR
jgi:hypothetical protein